MTRLADLCVILLIGEICYFVLRVKYGDLNEKLAEEEEQVESAE